MDYEPYRATRLWNEVIIAFQNGMPVKKHRRKMYTYNNCFTGSDAATWLHCYLLNNPNFGRDVSRQQTVNLLGKFLKCHVIESITFKSKKCEFSDSSHLYRFIQISPQQLKTLPLKLVQSPVESKVQLNNKKNHLSFKVDKYPLEFQKENIPECRFVEKRLSSKELGLLWKNVTLERLKTYLCVDIMNDINESFINGHVIKHNVSRISKTGVVILIDKTDDIPHWVISAMKCLANWPNASGSGSCLPNYPGFEKDVFKVVKDFFINPQEPLLPKYLSSAMLSAFTYFLKDYIKIEDDFKSYKDSSNLSNRKSELNIKTSTPVSECEKNESSFKDVSLAEKSDGKLLLDDPEVMWVYPSPLYFETNFATSDPVTKMVPTAKLNIMSYDQYGGSIESLSTISVCSINPDLKSVNNYQSANQMPLKNWNSVPCLMKGQFPPLQSSCPEVNAHMENNVRRNQSMIDFIATCDKLNESICSSKTIIEEEEDFCLGSMSIVKHNSMSSSSNKNFPCSSCEKNSSHNYGSKSKSIKIDCSLKQLESITYPPELKASFQLLLLFLNPPNRRQLHLLFRVINKILKNKKFILDVQMPMRNYLLHTFLPAIVQSDFDDTIILGMVSFLVDHCEEIFQPPVDLNDEVEKRCKLHNSKIIFTMDDASFLTYCEMVSKQQYEEQKVTMSADALKKLLQNILTDKNLHEKERKKRIKQFKENHPDVYQDVLPGKQDPFPRTKSTFLNRLANLRM